MTSFTTFRRRKARVGKINGAVKRPLNTSHLFSFHEICGREHVVSIVNQFLRKNILNDTKIKLLKLFCKFLRIGLTMEHRSSHEENTFDRIRFAGNGSLERNLKSCGCFRINDLVDALFFSHLPSFAVGTFACRNTGDLEAGPDCYNQTSRNIYIAVHRVGNADQLIQLNVGSVLRGVPAVIDHTF